MLYTDLKMLHVLCAAASLLLFVGRGGVTVLMARRLVAPVWKWLPPVIDTLLLGLGIWLAVLLELNPLQVPWLGVKLLCVIGYIVLGILAFRLRGPHWLKVGLFVAAILLFGFIVSIAVWHDARGVFALMG
ncbi:MAG TPA: SirB2 family protein [Gammaproteobacteria bacterium]|nr:SirB2 family protein [Gammaproteobacteria bacterium]